MILAGHSIDEARLPKEPTVLDVGARGFSFCMEIKSVRPKARIIALDPDPAILIPANISLFFLQMALVGENRKTSGYASYSTGEGNMLTDLESYYDARMLTVNCINMQDLMRLAMIRHWDLVKLDCEGSEFDILMNWPGPIATQISVEFHDGHPAKEGPHRAEREAYYAALWKHLDYYQVVQHEITKQGDWYGHWDTLLTLK